MVEHALLFACAAAMLSVIAERLHARRVARAARLAFGARGAATTGLAWIPFARPVAIFAGVFGAYILMRFDPVEVESQPKKAASRHLLICMDVSPSMQIVDAGPDSKKISRADWSGKLMQGVLDRIDMQDTRISMVVYYTDALVMFEDTFDKEVIRNALDGLPLYAGFRAGATDIRRGIEKSFEIAKKWPEDSATLIVVGDGDSEHAVESVRMPLSIADTIVIGVGDPNRPTIVNGHNSNQDTLSLRQLAARLGGVYHQGNTKHIPSEVLQNLSMISPRISEKMSLQDIALWTLVSSAGVLGLSTPILLAFGTPRSYRQRIGQPPDRAEVRGVA